MVALFLRGELASERFGGPVREALAAEDVPAALVTAPDLEDAKENAIRLRLLDATRAYARREGLFDGFPNGVRWDWVAFTRDELLAVRYIDWSYGLELSGQTRLPTAAAAQIRAGREAFGVSNDGFLALASELACGARWPPLIVASTSSVGDDVLVEGHVRLTAMALAPEALPNEIETLRGVSPAMASWSNY
jgi:hypothetical protein